MTDSYRPDVSVIVNLERLARTELSLGARLAHVLLTLVASTMTIVIASVWLTEPALPARTSGAFALLTAIGLGWVIYGLWVLNVRRVMLARQRVIAGRLAVAFTGTFTAGSLLLALTTGLPGAWPASAMGLALFAIALTLWRRAEANCAMLRARRDTLEQELQGRGR
jgi:hypothetical protein